MTVKPERESSPVALILIDVINDLNFPGSTELLKQALPMAHHLAHLKQRAKQHGVPCIYVNDNFGQWKSDFRRTISHCAETGSPGAPLVELLRPANDDYFVLKPKHSGFYATTLELLLEYLGVGTLILTGIAANICVLFTANDAYMRDYKLCIPTDCVAANTLADRKYSLAQMKLVLKADTRNSRNIKFGSIAHQGRRSSSGSASKLVRGKASRIHEAARTSRASSKLGS